MPRFQFIFLVARVIGVILFVHSLRDYFYGASNVLIRNSSGVDVRFEEVTVADQFTSKHVHFSTEKLNSKAWDLYKSFFFCEVPIDQAGPGDLIVFEDSVRSPAGHIGIIETVGYDSILGMWTGALFHAGSAGPGVSFWYDDPTGNWRLGGAGLRIGKVLRPRSCWSYPDLPDWAKAAQAGQYRDPLVLDLNGDGIHTLGLSAWVHFDHDGDGFKELTGWISSGEGVLVLDKNGNGLLDNGSELFGDFTFLPNGTRAGNGFQALAMYQNPRSS
jgi:hypothetical protein